ncbi:hypothetical protein L7F22_063285 [Adiantum nelumboides]|nr:hypothetical protein [Adiantum nelumboides]
MASKARIKVFEYGVDEKNLLGYVRADLDCTYSAIRQEIVQDDIANQEFYFFIKDEDDDELCTLNSTQEERWQVENKIVGIKRLVSTVEQRRSSKRVCRSVNDTKEDSAMDVVEEGCERVQNFKGGEVQGNNMLKSLFLTRSSLELWKAQCEKTQKKLRERNPLRDDNFELATKNVNNNPVIRVLCHECRSAYGTGIGGGSNQHTLASPIS